MDELSNGIVYEKELTRIFNDFNSHFWNNELPNVLITFHPTKSSHGHITTEKVWVPADEKDNSGKCKYELNISAYTIDRKPEEICETLLHEQCHLYNIIHGIQDCFNGSRYHNNRFKKTAESHGLLCKKMNSVYGWCDTHLNDEAKKYIKKINVKQFELKRVRLPKAKPPLIKYSCPACDNFCYITNTISKMHSVLCGQCNLPMTAEKKNR